MIPAAKSPWISRRFAAHVERRMARRFSSVYVRGLEATHDIAARSPVLFVANHTSWWDPLVAILLSHRRLDQDAYALMDATNLRRRPFFSRVGAVGVEPGDARSGARAIRHCAELLDRPRRALWIFPEGREVPHGHGPLAFKPGAAAVARRAPLARVIPVGLRYVLGGDELPQAWISLGPVLRDAGVEDQARAVQRELDRIADALPGPPAPEWVTTVGRRVEGPSRAERLLAALIGPRARPRALPERT